MTDSQKLLAAGFRQAGKGLWTAPAHLVRLAPAEMSSEDAIRWLAHLAANGVPDLQRLVIGSPVRLPPGPPEKSKSSK